ncbi:MAG: helix-turn-helix transcriptional regulator [Deferribacteraceae bacterium]|jgi:transcriptional regulator with XRE-family HTH domain|nr:helix-turn-helix transcriptional regulator [Deferribacteraceae bacterium]
MSMMKVFVFNMKKYRKKRRLSQMKLAEMINTSASYIGEIEINRKVPSLEMVEKIANALNVEPFRLFIDDDDRSIGGTPTADNYLKSLTKGERDDLAKRILFKISNDVRQILLIEDN